MMKIVISGKTGFIGSKLTEYFSAKGYNVTGIARNDLKSGVNHIRRIIDGADVLINLAGAPVAKRWTRSYSRVLWNSRIETTRLISEAIMTSENPPGIFLSASAVGYYSENGTHTEQQNMPSGDFLGILCERWEEEALRARLRTEVKIIRIGVVLAKEGGALPRMAFPFRLFAGGPIGKGSQIISWIHINDLLKAIDHIITKQSVNQVYNFTSPAPVSNLVFSSQLGRVLNRPNYLPVPAFALRLLFGEGAVVLLSGQNAIPESLINEGFQFQFPDINSALTDLLGSK